MSDVRQTPYGLTSNITSGNIPMHIHLLSFVSCQALAFAITRALPLKQSVLFTVPTTHTHKWKANAAFSTVLISQTHGCFDGVWALASVAQQHVCQQQLTLDLPDP